MYTTFRHQLVAIIVFGLTLLLPEISSGQDYQLIVNRPSSPNTWNEITLNCRDNETVTHPDYLFWINNTGNDIRMNPDISSTESSSGFIVLITPEIEGNFFCGLNSLSKSAMESLIAYPKLLPTPVPMPKTVMAEVGTARKLNSAILPGALISQYSIDWKKLNGSDSEVVARISGPRNAGPINSPGLTVDPSSFSLTIDSVSYENRGSYRGLVYVNDPGGQLYWYTEEHIPIVILDVYERPRFITPLEDNVVSLSIQNFVTFSCSAVGIPTPTIEWYHNGKLVNSVAKYRVQHSPGNGDFTTISELTIYSLNDVDSGPITCLAKIPLEINNTHFASNSSAYLSVLGNLILDMKSVVTTEQEVIFNIHLSRPLPVELRVNFLYMNSENDQTHNVTSTNKFSSSEMISYLETSPPFPKFTVNVALVYGAIRGPVFVGRELLERHPPPHTDTSQPMCTILENTLVTYLVPAVCVVICFILFVVLILGSIACCRPFISTSTFKLSSLTDKLQIATSNLSDIKNASKSLPAASPPLPPLDADPLHPPPEEFKRTQTRTKNKQSFLERCSTTRIDKNKKSLEQLQCLYNLSYPEKS